MPALNWIGKDKIVNHDKELPYRVLKADTKLSVPGGNNLLIEGDNLEALKALMPFYYGSVKSIYIDPPYNTGNDSWVYSDKVDSPRIREWLNKTVGGEGIDLCRHDKWLCMMYPRLKLLRELMRDDGLIFISIDDNEIIHLKMICDEIFGEQNFVHQIIWKNKYGPGALTKGFGNVHEYILCYSRKPIESIEVPLSEEEQLKYKGRDHNYEVRGGFITQPLATRSKDPRPNLVYPIFYKGKKVMPDVQWIWSKDRLDAAMKNGEVVIRESEGKYSVRFKQYLRDESGRMRRGKPLSILNGPFNQEGTQEIRNIFGKIVFSNPKPTALIKYLFSIIVNGNEDTDGLYLDSFAGSGSTGHAVLEMNKEDNGNRRFVLVELEKPIAEKITAKRLNKVINGYKNALFEKGTSQGFQYLDLNGELFDRHGFINPAAAYNDLAYYIVYAETKAHIDLTRLRKPHLGEFNGVHFYLLYGKSSNSLDKASFSTIKKHAGSKVVFADKSLVDEEELAKESIHFKHIPYEIRRF